MSVDEPFSQSPFRLKTTDEVLLSRAYDTNRLIYFSSTLYKVVLSFEYVNKIPKYDY